MELDYYDKLLLGITGSFLVGIVVGVATAVPLHVAMVAGAIGAAPFVYAAMFQHPPLPESHPAVKASALAWHVVAVLAVGAAAL
ncbi:hypothetical protein [Natrialbaceae archaeon AArc-T1-2]|uniref:hypothetical protein n=1 Tax=Natrialbaceae archaeon AArc-T1-2 TaxID=3053904 RepID=UPI00255AE670|nr:hypothetical protein [Natrialbaceae archaeon AArc-T1-2]WIV68368.1 hypothetical protein QQ977_06505 [Natrialbaceae archaeon AArc-T1-2]